MERIFLYPYRIELPLLMKYHNVFHISLLQLAIDDAYPGQNMEPPPLVKIDGKDEYFIEAVLNSRIH
jgi:hypothetical protein